MAELSKADDVRFFLFTDTKHIIEAKYCGKDEKGVPMLLTNDGATVDNSCIVLWCNRSDLLQTTDFDKSFKRTKMFKIKGYL